MMADDGYVPFDPTRLVGFPHETRNDKLMLPFAFVEWRWSQGCGRAHLSRRECSYGSFRGGFVFSELFILFPSGSCHVITWLIAWL